MPRLKSPSFARIATMLLYGLAGCAPPAAAAADAGDRTPLIVRGANLWNADASAQPRDVLFENGRVARIAAAGSIVPPPAARVLDGRGQTLLPGLIDLHVHLGVPGGLPEVTPPAPARNWEISGRQLLRSGVTSARTHMTSAAGMALLAKTMSDPCAPLPRLHFSGPEIAGGTPQTETPNYIGVKSADDAAAKVLAASTAGFTWISVGDAGKFQPGELAALGAAARRHGLRLMAPVSNAAQLPALLAIGVDTLDDIDTTPAARYPDEPLRRLATMASVTLVPTVGYPYRVRAFERDAGLLAAAANYEFMTAAERTFVQATARAALKNDPYIVNNRRVHATLAAKFRQLLATGAPMATGTDAGSADHFHAGAIWWELQAWRAFGAPPRQALAAATKNAAGVVADAAAGALAEGSHADFVLYEGDVEQGALALERVRAVAKDGILFVRDGAWVGPARGAVAP
jgi:imidazolonepropionase-like amidohydrolase